MLRTAIDATFDRFHEHLSEKFLTMTDPREQLEYIARVHLQSSTQDRQYGDPDADGDAGRARTLLRSFRISTWCGISRWYARWCGAGRTKGCSGGMFRGAGAHCMFGAIDELLSTAVFTDRHYDVGVTAAGVMDVLLNGMGVGKARRKGNWRDKSGIKNRQRQQQVRTGNGKSDWGWRGYE